VNSTSARILCETLTVFAADAGGHLAGSRVVRVAPARRDGHLVLERPVFEHPEVVERQDVVALGLREPEVDELLDLLRVLLSEVVCLGAIFVRVEQLPAVLVELAEPDGHGAVLGNRLPALVPDAARAEHLVVLGLLRGRRVRGVELVAH
jgi:hypothetical protein